MGLKFTKLTRAALKQMAPGESISEHNVAVYKQPNDDVRYSINIMVDGQRIHRTVGRASEGVTREKCLHVIEKFRTEARECRLNLPRRRKTHLTFSEAADDYLALLQEGGGTMIDRKRQQLDAYLKPFFGGRPLSKITEFQVRDYCRQRRDAGAAAGTVNRELATLSNLFRIAASSSAKWISKDDVPRIKRLQEGRGRIVALSDEQCQSLLKSAEADQDPELWLFVNIGLHTSMRHGEIRRLRFDQLDENRRRFFIPKAKAGEREQPITVALTKLLVQERSRRIDRDGYIFSPGPGSRTPYRHTFAKAFARAVRAAELDPSVITPHVMRHTAITRLIKAGVDLPTVQKVSGHKTLAMVLRYSHVDGPHIDKATEALNFSPAITPKLHTGRNG